MKDAPIQREQTYVSWRRVWAMRLSILLFVRLLSVRLTLLGRMAAVALLLLLVVIAMALLAVSAVVIVARHVRFEAGL
jgi:hypothetical protein